MKYLTLVVLLAASPAYAATYSPTDAANHVGERVTIEGSASVYVSKGGTIFVDLGGSGMDAPFYGVIFKDNASAVPNITSLNGKTVDISGTVKTYRGRPEIIIFEQSQIHAK